MGSREFESAVAWYDAVAPAAVWHSEDGTMPLDKDRDV